MDEKTVFWNTLWCCRCVTPYPPPHSRGGCENWPAVLSLAHLATSWLTSPTGNMSVDFGHWVSSNFVARTNNERFPVYVVFWWVFLLLSCPILFSDCCPLYSSGTHLNTSHNETAEISTLFGPTVQWNSVGACSTRLIRFNHLLFFYVDKIQPKYHTTDFKNVLKKIHLQLNTE